MPLMIFIAPRNYKDIPQLNIFMFLSALNTGFSIKTAGRR